jgi:hypothetical protein
LPTNDWDGVRLYMRVVLILNSRGGERLRKSAYSARDLKRLFHLQSLPIISVPYIEELSNWT